MYLFQQATSRDAPPCCQSAPTAGPLPGIRVRARPAPRHGLALLSLLFAFAAAPVISAAAPDSFSGERGTFRKIWLRCGDTAATTSLAEDSLGRVFQSAYAGVFMFDGSKWQILPLPKPSQVWNLAVDSQNRIWCCGPYEMGVFTPQPDGSFSFRSLRALLPKEHLAFGNYAQIHIVDDAVFFVGDLKLFRWHDERFSVWDLPRFGRPVCAKSGTSLLILGATPPHTCWSIGSHEQQPTVVRTDRAKQPAEDDFTRQIRVALPDRDNSLLVFGLLNGIHRLDTAGSLAPAGWPSQEFFLKAKILDAVRLPEDRIAIATEREGVVIVSPDGRVLMRLRDEANDIPASTISRLFPTSRGNLLAVTIEGIQEWEIDLDVSYFCRRCGVNSRITDFIRHEGKLYAAGSIDLLRLEPQQDRSEPARFVRAIDHPRISNVVSMHHIDGRLLGAAEAGIVDFTGIADGLPPKVLVTPDSGAVVSACGLTPLGDHTMAVVTPRGPYAYDTSSVPWKFLARTAIFRADEIFPDPALPDTQIVASNRGQTAGIWRLHAVLSPEGDFSWAPPQPLIPADQKFNLFHLFVIGDTTFALTNKGTWRLTPGADSFTRTKPPGELWLWAGGDPKTGTGWKIRRIPNKGIDGYVAHALYRATPDPEEGWRADPAPTLLMNQFGFLVNAHLEPDGILWLGGIHGITRVDTNRLGAPRDYTPPRPRLASARAGDNLLPLDATLSAGKTEENNIEIAWTAPSANRFRLVRFQSRLEGIDKNWSAASTQTSRRIDSIPPGSYTFSVRAVSFLNQPGPETSLAFSIGPRWYNSWTLRALFVIAGGFALFGVFALRTRHLRKRQRELEIAVRRRTSELQTTNDALQQSTRAKTEFIRTVSHELRNPLAGARMMAELLLEARLDPPVRNRAAKLHGCLEYLQTMIDETLDLSRIELGQVPFRLNRFPLGKLIANTTAIFDAMASEKNIDYRTDLGRWGDNCYQAEITHLQRVLVNYLSNAFKFTQRGSVSLTVTAAASGPAGFETLRFTVTDTGPGVAPELRDRLFRAFVRNSDPLSQGSTPGTGLGLALCQKLAELSGGKVDFESGSSGGSSFWVEWPLLPTSPDPEKFAPGEIDLSEMRVLVVEDDPNQLEATELLLQELGVFAETAGNIDEAANQLRERPFHVILTDYNLGGATGLDLIARWQRLCGGNIPEVPQFHLITGHASDSVRESALEAGFFGFHKKPINLPELHGLLADAKARQNHTPRPPEDATPPQPP